MVPILTDPREDRRECHPLSVVMAAVLKKKVHMSMDVRVHMSMHDWVDALSFYAISQSTQN